MLVLSRKVNEKVMIGNDVTITIVKIDRNQVRIGIEAPRSVPVFRKEVWIEIQRDQAEAGEDVSDEVQKALEELKGD